MCRKSPRSPPATRPAPLRACRGQKPPRIRTRVTGCSSSEASTLLEAIKNSPTGIEEFHPVHSRDSPAPGAPAAAGAPKRSPVRPNLPGRGPRLQCSALNLWPPGSESSLFWHLEHPCSRLRRAFGSTGSSRSARRWFTIAQPMRSGPWSVVARPQKNLLLRMLRSSMRCRQRRAAFRQGSLNCRGLCQERRLVPEGESK